MTHTSLNKGFTLVELIVSVGLFALIMTLAAGSYFITVSIDQKAQARTTAVNNLSFALETMVRQIRTGTTYSCSGNPCTQFSFKDSVTGNTIVYGRTSDGAITQKVGSGNTVNVTDSSVNVSSLQFYLTGQTEGDTAQPHVSVVISGSVSTGVNTSVPFTIQSGATMRVIDI